MSISPAEPDPAPEPGVSASESRRVVEATRAWLQHAVVGLNLCPFAKAPLVKGQVRIVVCGSADPRRLMDCLCAELDELAAADPAEVETTLLVHPRALLDFEDYNDFLDAADAVLAERGHEGVLQIASFHPDYRFAEAAADDVSNATNRAPHPILHLLREASVARAVAAFPEASLIYEHNIATLERLGAAGWEALAARWRPAD